jgi:transcription elongation factor GreA
MSESDLRNGDTVGKTVNVGCRVVLVDLDTGEVVEYDVVSSANPGLRANVVSLWSPVGKALLGRVAGDCVQVQAPKGTVKYRVLRIEEAT